MAGFEQSGAPIELRSLPAMFDDSVARFASRPAIDFLGRRWTFGQLGDLVSRAARGLQDLGVGKGVQVGLCLPNTPYSVIFYYAALKAGGTVVNFNPLYVERELKQQIADSGTTVMVVPDLAMICRKVDAVAAETGLRKVIICPMAAHPSAGQGGPVHAAQTEGAGALRARRAACALHAGDRATRAAQSRTGLAAGGRGGAAIHRRHHRHAQGRDAVPRESDGEYAADDRAHAEPERVAGARARRCCRCSMSSR